MRWSWTEARPVPTSGVFSLSLMERTYHDLACEQHHVDLHLVSRWRHRAGSERTARLMLMVRRTSRSSASTLACLVVETVTGIGNSASSSVASEAARS